MSSKQYSSVTSAVYSSYCLCRILKRVGSRYWNISRGADSWQSAERGQGGSPPQLHRACCRHAGLSEAGVLQPNYYHHGEGQGWWGRPDFVKCFAAECKQSNHVHVK